MSKDNILQQLADDARRLRVARKLPDPDEGKLSWDWIRRVQTDFNAFLEKSGLSLTQVSRQMGKGYSTSVLSQFAGMKSDDHYLGDIDRIVRGVNAWMEAAARKADAPRIKGWIETEVARRMLILIGKTIEMRCMGIIYSDAGRGKTMTLEAAGNVYPGAILVRIKRNIRSPSGLARALCHHLGIRGARNLYDQEMKLIDMLKGTDRPLLLDEAHQFNSDALELIRDLHDECKIPVVLVGTRKVEDKCSDHEIFFGQFASRVGFRYDVTEQLRGGADGGGKSKPLHSMEEILKMFASDKVRLTDDGAMALTKLGNIMGIGGLRLCQQVAFAAASFANAKGTKITAGLIINVLKSMHGGAYAVNVLQRKLEESDIRIEVA